MNPVATVSRDNFLQILELDKTFHPVFRYEDSEKHRWYVVHLPNITVRNEITEGGEEQTVLSTKPQLGEPKVILIFDSLDKSNLF